MENITSIVAGFPVAILINTGSLEMALPGRAKKPNDKVISAENVIITILFMFTSYPLLG